MNRIYSNLFVFFLYRPALIDTVGLLKVSNQHELTENAGVDNKGEEKADVENVVGRIMESETRSIEYFNLSVIYFE